MATYNNDLRLKEIGTGDESGTWGTSTNINLALIADAFGYGTKAIPTDANATFTMPDASTDGTRAMYLKITSSVSLTTTRTVTLGPNTVSKVWIIENATTGSQSITISQGSGGTVTIASGAVAMVYTDGAGAGASVVSANPTVSANVTTSGNNAFTGANTFYNATGQTFGTATAAQDGIIIAGRAGGTSTYRVTLQPTTLSASRTLTLPDVTDTLAAIGTAQTFTAAQTFRAASAIRSEAASTQDAIVLAGRAGGSSSYAVTLTPATLSANRTVTFPDETMTVGFRNVPPVGTKTGSYVLATSDVGKYVQVGSGGSITIPDATFSEGDAISIFNNTSGNITITCSITTAYIAGIDSDKATMTLSTRGVATILFISSTVCVVSGNVS